MNKNKGSASDYRRQDGFTLIELLVVIAIIGVLASVVLASLSSARQKAKIAAVQSTLSSMRAQAEIGVVNGKFIPDICTASASSGGLVTLLNSLNKPASKVTSIACSQNTTGTVTPSKWAVEAQIDGKYYCTDSNGYSGLSLPSSIPPGSAKALAGSQDSNPTLSNPSPIIQPLKATNADVFCT